MKMETTIMISLDKCHFILFDSGAKLDLTKAPKARAAGQAIIALELE
jgi:hypothetical protein